LILRNTFQRKKLLFLKKKLNSQSLLIINIKNYKANKLVNLINSFLTTDLTINSREV